ncbi:MAG TPA: glycosyltransferase 87 family protein [Gaiellaceae bacterium]|nr:glycosyltransferase 87 family protein [Gaiellaceae bacterium]
MSRAGSAALIVAAVGLFLVSWSLLHHGTLARAQITDTGLYQQYGDAMAHGQVPYRDFRLEYPPGALPVFVVPSLGHEGDRNAYDRCFDRLMALCGCVAIVGTALALRALGAGTARTAAALGLVAISPLLVGSVVLSRFDLWPASLAVLALAALLHERLVLAALALGAAIAAKLWPLVLTPLVIVHVWRTRGPRAAVAWAVGLVLADAAIFLPFAVLSPAGLRASFHAQISRPLQLESFGGAVLVALHHIAGTSLHVVTSYGSQNLEGTGTHAVEIATTVAGALALLTVWVLYAQRDADGERLVAYAAAAVAATLAFGKVFSPQFVIWLVPFVPLVRGRRGIAASSLLVAALVLTQLWFPQHYWPLAQGFAQRESWLLLARDLAVVALATLLAWPRLEHESLGEGRAMLEALQRVRAQVD